ncbi:signal transducing kinase of the PAK, partial [Actinomortierella ambigua]
MKNAEGLRQAPPPPKPSSSSKSLSLQSVPPSSSSSSSSLPASPLHDTKDPVMVSHRVPPPKKGPPPPQKPSRSQNDSSAAAAASSLYSMGHASPSPTPLRHHSPHESLRPNHTDSSSSSNNSPMVAHSSPKSTYRNHHYEPSEYSSNRSTFKGVFSNIVSSMSDLLSSDKKIEISSPYNPVHLTHVGYNLDTGEFT